MTIYKTVQYYKSDQLNDKGSICLHESSMVYFSKTFHSLKSGFQDK